MYKKNRTISPPYPTIRQEKNESKPWRSYFSESFPPNPTNSIVCNARNNIGKWSHFGTACKHPRKTADKKGAARARDKCKKAQPAAKLMGPGPRGRIDRSLSRSPIGPRARYHRTPRLLGAGRCPLLFLPAAETSKTIAARSSGPPRHRSSPNGGFCNAANRAGCTIGRGIISPFVSTSSYFVHPPRPRTRGIKATVEERSSSARWNSVAGMGREGTKRRRRMVTVHFSRGPSETTEKDTHEKKSPFRLGPNARLDSSTRRWAKTGREGLTLGMGREFQQVRNFHGWNVVPESF